jgi:hypothetical protein
MAILTDGVASELLEAPINALRVSLHPGGLAPRIVNLAEYGAHLIERLEREVAASADGELQALADELRGYPGVVGPSARDEHAAAMLFVPLVLRAGSVELRFFSTVATFGTALDITVAEMAIESFFPADDATAAALRANASAA